MQDKRKTVTESHFLIFLLSLVLILNIRKHGQGSPIWNKFYLLILMLKDQFLIKTHMLSNNQHSSTVGWQIQISEVQAWCYHLWKQPRQQVWYVNIQQILISDGY